MRKIHGFTLIELLSVIVLLSLILAIAVPSISNIIDNSRLMAYKSSESLLVNATKKYVVANGVNVPQNIGGTLVIPLADLQTNKFVDVIQDSEDKNIECDGYVLIRKTDSSSYSYEPFLRCGDNYSTDGLIAWYPMDGNANDLSGNNYNGTGTSIVWEQDGPHTVARFNGSSLISVTNFYNSSSPNPVFLGTSPSHADNYNGNATYSAWVKPTSLDSTARFVFSDHNYNEGIIQFLSNSISVNWSGNTVNHSVAISSNRWYYVTLTHERNLDNNNYILKLYVDGTLIGQNVTTVSSSIYYGPDVKLIMGYQWLGLIDDVRIYNKVLTADQILENYNISNYGR